MYGSSTSPLLSREELKIRLIEHLRNRPQTQWENIAADVERSAGRRLSIQESTILLELVHEFTSANIVMPFIDRHNVGWPWMSVTAHGREVLGSSGPPIYDYEGYLADLRSRVPDLDETVAVYVGESLRTYQTNSYLASMVMLGCASERAMRTLFDAYTGAIDNARNQEKLRQRLNGRDISKAYDEFRRSFDTTRSQVQDPDIVNDFDVHVEGVFSFVRLLRNSIVHPTGVPNITSAVVYANLQQFSQYTETVFKLISYYRDNNIAV